MSPEKLSSTSICSCSGGDRDRRPRRGRPIEGEPGGERLTGSYAVIVGIGQDAAGDDGIGLAVARALIARGVPARPCADASVLLPLFAEGRRVVLIDAVIGAAPGTVMQLDPDALATGPAPVSSHGLGVREAIALGRTLYGAVAIAIVGIAIDPPREARVGLSAAVEAAIAPASALASALATGG
ncbi:MAG: hydrogenase maturation protease [Deltaproteobacteria bacterium]|nr:hydrogenase maturation protease [Deltaproteobacteria bacterium]